MPYKHSIQHLRNWYAKLLRLYSRPYYERFGEGMEQTFNDLLLERAREDRALFAYAFWMFLETSAGITKERNRFIIMNNQNIVRIALGTVAILLIPLFAMLFTSEVTWDLADFIIAGLLLFATGLTFHQLVRRAENVAYRAAVGVALVTGHILVWVNLAVGIIGSEDNPANLMYVGVLVVGVIGALISRLHPHGMSLTLSAMAIAQALVPVFALIFWKPSVPSLEATMDLFVWGVSALFALLFGVSAMLFRRAHALTST